MNFKRNIIDRWDIYNNLPSGTMSNLSREFDCSKTFIKFVLEGKRKDTKGIIKRAELIAAINIWKTRFCTQDKSKL